MCPLEKDYSMEIFSGLIQDKYCFHLLPYSNPHHQLKMYNLVCQNKFLYSKEFPQSLIVIGKWGVGKEFRNMQIEGLHHGCWQLT